MRLRYYDKHGTEIQAGMLLRHDDGASVGWNGLPGAPPYRQFSR